MDITKFKALARHHLAAQKIHRHLRLGNSLDVPELHIADLHLGCRLKRDTKRKIKRLLDRGMLIDRLMMDRETKVRRECWGGGWSNKKRERKMRREKQGEREKRDGGREIS